MYYMGNETFTPSDIMGVTSGLKNKMIELRNIICSIRSGINI